MIKGACRHLVNDRMDLTSARWRLDRAEAVLRIRALRTSGDCDEYWQFHKLQEFQAELASLEGRVDNLEIRTAFLEDHQYNVVRLDRD